MQIIKYPVKIVLVTVSDVKDPQRIFKELKEHGKVIGTVFTEGEDKVKGGAFLWKHKRFLRRDEFILTLIGGIPKLSEGIISKRGIFNLKKFHENYPEIPIIDIGVSINASEIVNATDKFFKRIKKKIKKLKGMKYKGDLSKAIEFHNYEELKELIKNLEKKKNKSDEEKEQLEELKEELKLQKKINEYTGISTRELKVGVLITEKDKDFKNFVNQLEKHAGKVRGRRELWAGRFKNEDIGLIVWHREQLGQDTYWVFLVLDKDTMKSGTLIDWEGPDIEMFIKRYLSVPVIAIPKLKTDLALEPSTILRRLEHKKKSSKLKI